jgi:uncharacterized membrane-anchored protein
VAVNKGEGNSEPGQVKVASLSGERSRTKSNETKRVKKEHKKEHKTKKGGEKELQKKTKKSKKKKEAERVKGTPEEEKQRAARKKKRKEAKERRNKGHALLLMDLPDEIQLHIMTFLSATNLCVASLVCREVYHSSSCGHVRACVRWCVCVLV